jgi:hypothetical protein
MFILLYHFAFKVIPNLFRQTSRVLMTLALMITPVKPTRHPELVSGFSMTVSLYRYCQTLQSNQKCWFSIKKERSPWQDALFYYSNFFQAGFPV